MSSDLGSKPEPEQQNKALDMTKSEVRKDTETKENVNSQSSDSMPDSDSTKKAHPDNIKVGKNMPRLPPIDMAQLTSILQGPNMPSQKLMKEVTEKIKIKNDESGSDDGSVSGGGGVGIRGILDCILEASLFHQDSEEESDLDEDDEIFVRELPCKFCKKVFGSTMNLKTHVLMTHSQEDPSVLNVRNQSKTSGRKERLSMGGRTRSMEGKEKESSLKGHKRSRGQQEIHTYGDDLREKQVRRRHSSKEQSSKSDVKRVEENPQESSSILPVSGVDCSKATTVSSQKRSRQSSHDKAGDNKCDLRPSNFTPLQVPGQSTHVEQEDVSSSSKATKRKSAMISSSHGDSSACAKVAKRSQCKSGEASVQPRRSSRKK